MNLQTDITDIESIPVKGLKTDPIQETIQNVPNLGARHALGIRPLISQFMPTGYRVIVNLPFIPNGKNYLFMIVHTPVIMPMQPRNPAGWIWLKGNNDIVLFDPPSDDLSTSFFRPIPSGISIAQYQEAPPLGVLSRYFRFWRGSIDYHIRVTSNFATNGYLRTSKLRQIGIKSGQFNRYAQCPSLMKRDYSTTESLMNSYVRMDASMFRHCEVTSPYEYPVDEIDNQLWFGNRSYFPSDDTTTRVEQVFADMIGVEAVGTLENVVGTGQMTFEIEYRAGDDFDMFVPVPMTNSAFDTNSRLSSADGSPTTERKANFKIPDIRPNTSIISDGIDAISAA